MNIITFLPSFCAIESIGREFTPSELKVVDSNKENTYFNYGNTTSCNTKVLNDLPELKSKVEDLLTEYTKTVICPKSDNFKLVITQSWFNYTEQGGFHHKHTHGNSIVSGVIYFNAVQDIDRIQFWNDRNKELLIPPKEYNPLNSTSWWIPVKTGDIILFPSTSSHSVPTTNYEQTRVSLAFNTFVEGELGSALELTQLIIPPLS